MPTRRSFGSIFSFDVIFSQMTLACFKLTHPAYALMMMLNQENPRFKVSLGYTISVQVQPVYLNRTLSQNKIKSNKRGLGYGCSVIEHLPNISKSLFSTIEAEVYLGNKSITKIRIGCAKQGSIQCILNCWFYMLYEYLWCGWYSQRVWWPIYSLPKCGGPDILFRLFLPMILQKSI